MKKSIGVLIGLLLSVSVFAGTNKVVVKMYRTEKHGHGLYIGTITMIDSKNGLFIQPDLKGLKPGMHGFHIHIKPSCDNFGKAAGGHFDPKNTGKHLGPYNPDGHLGDLPALYFNKDKQCTMPVFAPRLTLVNLFGHSLMIHAGGDNYSDTPKKLGGGGARVACGKI